MKEAQYAYGYICSSWPCVYGLFLEINDDRVSKLTYPTLQHCLRMLYTMNGNSKHYSDGSSIRGFIWRPVYTPRFGYTPRFAASAIRPVDSPGVLGFQCELYASFIRLIFFFHYTKLNELLHSYSLNCYLMHSVGFLHYAKQCVILVFTELMKYT